MSEQRPVDEQLKSLWEVIAGMERRLQTLERERGTVIVAPAEPEKTRDGVAILHKRYGVPSAEVREEMARDDGRDLPGPPRLPRPPCRRCGRRFTEHDMAPDAPPMVCPDGSGREYAPEQHYA